MSASLSALPTGWLISPADSARAVAQVYTISLVATIPLIIAGAAALAFRGRPAGTRSLVWRSATAALLMVHIGHLLPIHWVAAIVPSALASPLVTLGRLQLAVVEYVAPVYRALGPPDGTQIDHSATILRGILLVYWAGVVLVLVPVTREWIATRERARRARQPSDPVWGALLHETRTTLGIRRSVRLMVASDAVVPITWGVFRPVILLPESANTWSEIHRRAVLLHELAHVRGADVFFTFGASIVCALFWFHPAAWWIARRLHEECELACDDRVLAAGVRPSDYAELLMNSADAAGGLGRGQTFAVALSQGRGLRRRLASIVDSRRDIRPPTHVAAVWAVAITMAVAGPTSAVRLAPTKEVLTTLMRDARWESRAYAVMGLAQRPDSVAVARAAAELDPSPRVRAWARFALGRERGDQEVPSFLHELPALVPDQR